MNKIKIIRSIKRKTVSLQIMPDTSITLTVPYFFPETKIKKILREKQDWIEKKLREKQILTISQSKTTNELWYLGKKYPLEARLNKTSIVEFEDKFYIAQATRNHKVHLTAWYKQQARKIIQKRTALYAKRAGLQYNTITITEAKTRWGSASSDKNLHFNWRLICAPLPVIDYVISHELAHLTEMNHSRAFWQTVRKMFPLYRQYNTWLKRHGETLTI